MGFLSSTKVGGVAANTRNPPRIAQQRKERNVRIVVEVYHSVHFFRCETLAAIAAKIKYYRRFV